MNDRVSRMLSLEAFQRPTLCKECGGILIYKGIGEYQCEDCGALEYDNYGKVRGYLEKHKGANVAEISDQTGVPHRAIREMIKENRFEIIDCRGGYIRCEMCGENIKSGRLCSKCEAIYHRNLEAEARQSRNDGLSGFGSGVQGESGSKRFTRER